MGYTSYDFYRQKYFGESVSETEFPKWNEKASDKLDFLTSGNIRKIQETRSLKNLPESRYRKLCVDWLMKCRLLKNVQQNMTQEK